MNTKSKIKRWCCGILAGMMLCMSPSPVWATSKAEKEKKEAQQNLDKAKQEAAAAEAKKAEAQSKVTTLSSKLTGLLSDIQILENDLENKQEEIDQAEKDYEEAKAQEEQQYAAMKKRIQYIYEQGDTEYLEIFLKVKNMSDLLNKAEYVDNVYGYDRKMLEAYQETKQQVADYEEELKNDKAEMEGMQAEYKGQQIELEATIAEQKKLVVNFDSQMAQAKKEAAAYAKTVEKKTVEIRKAKEAEEKRQAEEAAKKAAAAKQSGNTTTKKTSGSTVVTKSTGGTASGRAVADYGLQFVGNPYVYGGTSLTNGTDCSGFTKGVYAHFGITLPRTSTEQRSVGRGVDYSEAQPGDLICYAGHIGIYIGNGQIVHASSPSTGIKVGNAAYRTILTVRRLL